MNMSLMIAAASLLGLTPGVSPIGGAQAAELKVLAGGSLRSVLTELAPQFEHASGHKLVIDFDTTPNLIKAATSGEPFDLGVVPIDVFYDAAAKVLHDERVLCEPDSREPWFISAAHDDSCLSDTLRGFEIAIDTTLRAGASTRKDSA